MSARGEHGSALGLALACVLAVVAALFSPARAEPGNAATPSTPQASVLHGLSPMPGGAPVPERLRPPGALPGDGGPSPVIFPPQSLAIRFNHAAHMKLGATCTTCHARAKTSRASADSLLPAGTSCDGCHGTNHRTELVTPGKEALGACGFCHLGHRPEDGQRVTRSVLRPPHLRFNHALHAEQRIDCAKCHGAVGSLELATVDQLPRMRGCFSCHTGESAQSDKPSRACPTCHLTERGGRLVTSFPEGTLEPPAWLHDAEHGPDWLERHKRIAADDSRFCASCHEERFCTGCHDGRVRPRQVHPNDFLSMHAVAARQNSPTCTSCHQQQSFCLSCHQRAGVTLSGPLGNTAGRGRFHPPAAIWTEGQRSAGHHAWEAERNLNACVSCHTERDCVLCHATAAVGGFGSGGARGTRSAFGRGTDPHPPGFISRCGRALRQNPRPCLVCHEPSDPDLGLCR